MSLVTVRMTRAEVAQLLDYAHQRDHGPEAGWYFGNKEQFERRHDSIVGCLELALGKSTTSKAAGGPS